MVVASSLPDHVTIWQRGRDSINIVLGGILGGFLGLTISRTGIQQGSYFDLFMLITLTAFTVSQILEAGNRYFESMRLLALWFLVSGAITAATSIYAAQKLGIDRGIVATIYGSWIFMILAQFAASELATITKRRFS